MIVDDERVLREGLKALLGAEGYAVRVARNGEEALAQYDERPPDLMLLDVMMPGMNGFRVCEHIRISDRDLPIIFLTARMSEADQVRGFGLGGDDYIFKTTEDSVLLAKIRRTLERVAERQVASPAEPARRVRLGSATVDFDAMVITGCRTPITLTKAEADFLWLLNTAPGRYFEIDEILEVVCGPNSEASDSWVYTLAYRLKHKLGRSGAYIDNNRRAGYRLLV